MEPQGRYSNPEKILLKMYRKIYAYTHTGNPKLRHKQTNKQKALSKNSRFSDNFSFKLRKSFSQLLSPRLTQYCVSSLLPYPKHTFAQESKGLNPSICRCGLLN